MSLRIIFNTFVKKMFQRILAKFQTKLFTKSDFSKNGLKPYVIDFFLQESKGILHIGGHSGQEAEYYSRFSFPVIWIEGNPNIYPELKAKAEQFGQHAIQALITEVDGAKIPFYLTSNNSESASLFPLQDGNSWTSLYNTDTIYLEGRRLDSIFSSQDLNQHNFWVIDVQGAELQVIRSAEELMRKCCRYALIEVSSTDFYSGGAKWHEVLSQMRKMGFIPLWLPNTNHEEVLFINSY